MTRDEIMQMPAGRELDLLVCETFDLRVPLRGVGNERAFYGFYGHREAKRLTAPQDMHHCITYYRADWSEAGRHLHHAASTATLPFYSGNIGAAWEVAEALRANGIDHGRFQLWHDRDLWRADFNGSPVATASTAPLAICRAALLASLSGALSPDPPETKSRTQGEIARHGRSSKA